MQHRRVRRHPADELIASYSLGSEVKRSRVKDISATGIYLLTIDRWPPGTTVDLTLRRHSILTDSPPPPVRLRARSVRLGLDGVGLMFEPVNIGADVWINLFLKAAELTAQKDTVRAFRISKALAFLRRVSPDAETRVLDHIAGESVYESGERAIDTILEAEELVDSWDFSIRTGVNPSVILSILEHASRTNSDWVRQHWAGLLASSIRYWAQDRECVQSVALLSRLEPVQIRILDAACSQALRAERDAGYYSLRKLTCSPETIRKIAGLTDAYTLEQHLDRLYFFGLLQGTVKRNLFGPIERANLTPTPIGRWLYVRCRGLLDPPEFSSRLHGRTDIYFQTAKDAPDYTLQEPERVYAAAS